MVKDKEEKIIDSESMKDKLGPDLIEEISNKEWKVAPLPTEEELAQEKHKSAKARNNKNSRRNLVQYRKNKPKETKKKIVEGLKVQKTREDVSAFDYISIEHEEDKNIIKAFLPSRKVFRSAKEEKSFYTILGFYLRDFDMSELSASDIEDIVSLSVNRIVENRLLEGASATEDVSGAIEEMSTTIERFRKHSEKVKSHLASRRSDRIDPKNKQNFSIVDLVYAYDDKKKAEFEQKMIKHEQEEKEYLDTRKKRS